MMTQVNLQDTEAHAINDISQLWHVRGLLPGTWIHIDPISGSPDIGGSLEWEPINEPQTREIDCPYTLSSQT